MSYRPVRPHFNELASGGVSTISAVPADLYSLEASNPNPVDVFLQLFDATSPTPGATAPVQSFLIPASSGGFRGAMDKPLLPPLRFNNALKYAVTTAPSNGVSPGMGVAVNATFSVVGT